MDKFSEEQKPKKAGKPPVPRPPDTCMVNNCSNDTEVIVMLARDSNNMQHADRPGRFVFVSKKEWHMKDGWKFDQYVTRCGKCYAHDVERYQQ